MTWDKEAMTKYYNEFAKTEQIVDDQIVSVPSARYKHIIRSVEQLISLMNFNEDDRVLDAGCGAGRFISRIQKTKRCQIFGIDTSPNMIMRARKRISEANFLIADILNLPFQREIFTSVISYSVLWHIPSKTGSIYFNFDIYERGLSEFRRVLKVGGRVLFNIDNPFHLQSIIDLFGHIINVKLLKKMGLQTYKMPLKMAKNMLSRLGFQISNVIASGLYPFLLETLYLPFKSNPSENTINWFYDSFNRLEKIAMRKNFLHLFASYFVIIAIKLHII